MTEITNTINSNDINSRISNRNTDRKNWTARGQAVSVNLYNGYEVWATAYYSKQRNEYRVKLFLNRCDIDMLVYFTDVRLEAERREVYTKIGKLVKDMHDRGEIDKYISEYETMLKAFDIGNDFLESEADVSGTNISGANVTDSNILEVEMPDDYDDGFDDISSDASSDVSPDVSDFVGQVEVYTWR